MKKTKKPKPVKKKAGTLEKKCLKEQLNNCDFSLPTRKEIAGLFNADNNFVEHKEMIDLVYKVVIESGLLGLDYGDIKNIIVSNSKFKLIKTFLNEIKKHQSAIDDSTGVFVVFTCGSNDTLGFVNAILEEHFKKSGACVSQCFIDSKVQSGNPKLEIILANR